MYIGFALGLYLRLNVDEDNVGIVLGDDGDGVIINPCTIELFATTRKIEFDDAQHKARSVTINIMNHSMH